MELEHLKFNEFQTLITEELISLYPEEVIGQLYDFILNVPLIKWLVSLDRPRAKDLQKDSLGKIIVDITKPHILEDMDYFRQPALHYMKHGCYTLLRPNSNPQSEYRKFWEEEIRRCLEGYVRQSDGEWVTGYCYWFLNYNPMMINRIIKGSRKAERVQSFPYMFEGIYYRFHYLYQARLNGKHAIELAKRGCAKAHPYDAKVFTPEGWKLWGEINIGDKLYGDNGKITTVINIPFDDVCPIYKIELSDGRTIEASEEHLWNVRCYPDKKIQTLSTRQLLFSYKDSRGFPTCFIPKHQKIEFEECSTPFNPYLFGKLLGYSCLKYRLRPAQNIKDYTKTDITVPREYKYNSSEVRLLILKGLMDISGDVRLGSAPYFDTRSEQLALDVMEISRSLGYNCTCHIEKTGYKTYFKGQITEGLPYYHITIYGGKELFNLPRKQSKVRYAFNTNKTDWTSIKNISYVGQKQSKCVTVDNASHCYLIGDFIVTHNSYSLSSIMTHNLILGESMEVRKRVMTVLAAYQKEYLKDDKDGTFSKFRPALNFINEGTPFPRLLLKNSPNEMSWQMGYKDEFGRDKGSFNTTMGVAIKDDEAKLRGKRGTFLFEEMGNMPNLLTVYDITRKSVEDGDYTFGLIYLVGTAAEEESDFASAKKLLLNPNAYNIYSLLNVYDKFNLGSKYFGFFFPAYMNRAGCYNEDGVSDVVKALLEILMARYTAKYNSADPKSVLRAIAEDPIVPTEAIIKVKAAYFPTDMLNERAHQLDSNPNIYDDVYVGKLVLSGVEVKFIPTNHTPIREFGNVPNTTEGALEIFEMPERDSNGNVFALRYIIGHDPVDNDTADSSSLSSTIVLDLFTDRIVAEYTGRHTYAEDNYEVVRLLCIFYNAKCMFETNKKGLFAYFKGRNSLRYLAETPEYLRAKNLIKYSNIGSNAYGINASADINNYANERIRDWLLKPVTSIQKGEDGEPREITMPLLYLLRNRALLLELIDFNPYLNVDRIRALGMVMLYREEKIILYQGDMSKTVELDDKDYAGNDEFFDRNFNADKSVY